MRPKLKVNMNSFPVLVDSCQSIDVEILPGTVLAIIYNDTSSRLEAAIDIPEPLFADVPSLLFLATELASRPDITTTQSFLAHLDSIIESAESIPEKPLDDFIQPPPPPEADPSIEIDHPPLPTWSSYVDDTSTNLPLDKFSQNLDKQEFDPMRYKTKDTSQEERMDYIKDTSIISDEELLSKFDLSHITNEDTRST
ncbi:hypothetical protein HDU76_011545 [Blyttiomyces sp. JEL0837]|nr:hypothetical protein HDU76_011545 [Blyttiomyces sp. JEL0837]